MSVLRRVRREQDGLVLPGAMALLVIFLLMTGVALSLSLGSLDRTNRDRQLVRALQAADAGADAAVFRLNKMLVSPSVAGLLGPIPGTVQSLGCTSVAVGGFRIEPTGGPAWCAATPSQTETLHSGSAYSYEVSGAITVSGALGDLLERRIVSTGTAGDVQRRVLVRVRLSLVEDPGSPAIYRRLRHVECTATRPEGSAPDGGCPGT